MLRFGITGKSGAGKSTVAQLFEKYGVVHVDADKVAHSIYEPGTPCAAEIAAHFGPSVLLPDGSVDRRSLSAIVFSDAAHVESLGPQADDAAHAHALFDALRSFDAAGVRAIYGALPGEQGISLAVRNRLLKAAGHHVVHL